MLRCLVSRCLLTNPVAGQTRKLSGGSLAGSQSSLAGKVAIVTASTDGIGLAAAQALGQRGARVVVSSRRQSNVDKAVALLQSEKIQVTGTTCNVGNSEDRARLVNMTVEQCGGVDIFVSNAAVNPFFGNIMDSTEAVWDKILDVNVKSAFLMTQLVVPHMEKRGGGSVVFVSSVAGYQPMQALGPYSVSKTALLGLTRAMAPELAQSHIWVNCVAPGVIKTPFSQAVRTPSLSILLYLPVYPFHFTYPPYPSLRFLSHLYPLFPSVIHTEKGVLTILCSQLWQDEDVVDEFKKQLSIKRFGKPEEIGGVIAFLCSKDASYITGETITVTGGMSCRL
nr:dehydrogenase/reductase SDR family member 4-like isoform X2 [Oncorhynchus gorbuscha]XP_046184729.1 dehydrogenase/reductase SDR family member 4-like isoform X2 [Oncorhynchus gorbuscha]